MFLRRFSLCCFLFYASISAHSQHLFSISGSVKAYPDTLSKTWVLERYFADEFYFYDSLLIQNDFTFQIVLNKPELGQYRLRVKRSNYSIDFIVSQVDPGLFIDCGFDGNGFYVSKLGGSTENLLYEKLKRYNQEVNDSMYKVLYLKKALNRFDPARKAKQDAIDSAASKAVNYFNLKIQEVKKNYFHTFTGRVLSDFSYTPNRLADTVYGRFFDNEDAYLHRYYLKNIDFSNPEILHHQALKDILQLYFSSFHANTQEGYKTYTDHLMMISPVHETVKSFLYAFLIKKFVIEKQDVAIQYLLNNYEKGCNDEGGVIKTSDMVDILKRSAPGEVVPDFTFPDRKKKPVSLRQFAGKHSITVLFLWKTNCEHCRDYYPQLYRLQETYNEKLGIYALSIDAQKEDWLSMIKEDTPHFSNTHATKEELTFIFSNIPMVGTPSIMLIDQSGIIMKRLVEKSLLSGIIKTYLKE